MTEIAAADAAMDGAASSIGAKDEAAVALQSAPAVLRATIHITRASGVVETFDVVGTPATATQQES